MKKTNKSLLGFIIFLFILTVIVELYILAYIRGVWVDVDDLFSILEWGFNRDNYQLYAIVTGIILLTELGGMITIARRE